MVYLISQESNSKCLNNFLTTLVLFIYQHAGPKFEYWRDFYFMKRGKILKFDFFPKTDFLGDKFPV